MKHESNIARKMIRANRAEIAAQQERNPMTGTEVMDEYIKTRRFNQFVEAFFAGVKCAEAFHGIKETP